MASILAGIPPHQYRLRGLNFDNGDGKFQEGSWKPRSEVPAKKLNLDEIRATYGDKLAYNADFLMPENVEDDEENRNLQGPAKQGQTLDSKVVYCGGSRDR